MATVLEGGNALVEGTKAYNDIQANAPDSPDAFA